MQNFNIIKYMFRMQSKARRAVVTRVLEKERNIKREQVRATVLIQLCFTNNTMIAVSYNGRVFWNLVPRLIVSHLPAFY